MSTKGTKYHLEIQTHRKKPYGLLRTSYREDGKTRHQTLCRISDFSMEQLRAMQAAIQGKTIARSDFKITRSREYGACFSVVSLMKELGLHKDIFSRPSEEWVRCCLAMIAGRLVYAGSKLSLSHCGSYSALWDVCGIEAQIDVNSHCCGSMDKLLERQGAIQKSLAQKHLPNATLVLYDITSCYMEGEYSQSELVNFGYNRDQKRGHEQIVISLLCAKNGCPVAVDVLKGNTKDETTVLDKINEIKEKYGLEKVIFVGDRGMITQAKYEQLDHETVKVISALTHNSIKKLRDKGVVQQSQFDEKSIVEITDGELRYCLCKNPDMAVKEATTRKTLLEKTTTELDKIIQSTKITKKSKEFRAGRVTNKYNMGKFIIPNGNGNDFTYSLDEAKIEQESLLDGCYVVYTDVSAHDITAYEAVQSYKNLMRVEQAFRNMKTVRLEIRPIYHKTDDRIKCHVFICMLAYYVMWHMKQRLAPLFKDDGVGPNRKYTFDYVMESLKNIREETVEIKNAKTNILTEASPEQKHILNLLGVKM